MFLFFLGQMCLEDQDFMEEARDVMLTLAGTGAYQSEPWTALIRAHGASGKGLG